jgi:hypothetical protein
MIKFFSTQQIVSLIVILPLFMLGLWLPNFIEPSGIYIPTSQFPSPFFDVFVNIFKTESLVLKILSFLAVFFQGILFNAILNQQELLKKRNYLPALFYVLIMSSFSGLQNFNPLIFTNFLLLPIFALLNNFYMKRNIKTELFAMGILIGIASLFYFPIIVLVLYLFLALIIITSPEWRHYFIIVVGAVFPYYWFYALKYLFDSPVHLLSDKKLDSIDFSQMFSNIGTVDFLYLGFWIFFLVISLFAFLTNSNQMVVRVKNILNSYLAYLFISLLMLFWISKYPLALLGVLAFPFSIFLSHFFNQQKKEGFKEFSFWIIYLTILAYQIY